MTGRSDELLRRAIALAAAEGAPDGGTRSSAPALSASDLADVARQIDVPVAAVAAALAEYRAGAPTKRTLTDRVVGPSVVWARQQSTEDEEQAKQRVLQWLETAHGLRPRVRPDGVVVAAKRRDIVGKVSGAIRRANGLGGLGRVKNIAVAAVDIEDEPAVVCLVADVTNKRNEAIAGGTAVAGGGLLLVGLAAVVGTPAVWIVAPAALGAGIVTSRLTHQATVRGVSEDVELTVDGIAAAAAPPRLRDRVARSWVSSG